MRKIKTAEANPKKLAARQAIENNYRELLLLEYEKCNRDFSYFFRRAWLELEPQTKLLYNWHHEVIAEYLTACYLRQIKRLIINIPPRYSKSNLVTVTFPPWVWIHKPEERFVFSSYSNSLSNMHSVHRRNVIESIWYQARWQGNYQIALGENMKTEFANTKRGRMIATSMGAAVTGKGGNILIIDDPHDPTRAESKIQRENTIKEFDNKFTTRLDDKKEGVIIIVMQRVHESDLTGHCLEQGGYEHLCLPAEAPKPVTVNFPISKKQKILKKDDVLHPEREGKSLLDAQKIALGSYGYAAQYQQSPSPREGGLFKRDWWQRYARLPEKIDKVIDSWDCSFKDLQTSNYVAGEVWAIKGANKYLLHITKKKLGFVDTIKAMVKHKEMFPEIIATLIEDKANGTAIIEVLKKKVSGLIPFNPQGSKEERASAIEPQCEAGNIFLPVKGLATFDVEDFIDVCALFPNAAEDDVVDAMTQALIYLESKKNYKLEAMGLI